MLCHTTPQFHLLLFLRCLLHQASDSSRLRQVLPRTRAYFARFCLGLEPTSPCSASDSSRAASLCRSLTGLGSSPRLSYTATSTFHIGVRDFVELLRGGKERVDPGMINFEMAQKIQSFNHDSKIENSKPEKTNASRTFLAHDKHKSS